MAQEQKLQFKIKEYCKKRGCLCWKLASPSNRGVPDLMILCMGARILFLELKAPGKKPTPLQHRNLRLLQEKGFDAYWTDSWEVAKQLIDERTNRTK